MSVLADAASRMLRSRRLMRAPIWLYRARLGGVLGGRLLMLEHIGRKTGARRRVVLEVLEARDHPDSYVVASGFGDRAQWFRNITANPHVRISAGSRRPAPATARVLDQPEADRVLGDYIARHPRTWEQFSAVLEQTLGEPVTATDTALPLVELRLGR